MMETRPTNQELGAFRTRRTAPDHLVEERTCPTGVAGGELVVDLGEAGGAGGRLPRRVVRRETHGIRCEFGGRGGAAAQERKAGCILDIGRHERVGPVGRERQVSGALLQVIDDVGELRRTSSCRRARRLRQLVRRRPDERMPKSENAMVGLDHPGFEGRFEGGLRVDARRPFETTVSVGRARAEASPRTSVVSAGSPLTRTRSSSRSVGGTASGPPTGTPAVGPDEARASSTANSGLPPPAAS